MEQASKAQAQVEALRDVNEAQRQLASGNVREASVSFYRAKVKSRQRKRRKPGCQATRKRFAECPGQQSHQRPK